VLKGLQRVTPGQGLVEGVVDALRHTLRCLFVAIGH
jgi:hypothetical protein